MAIQRWDPVRDMIRLKERMNRLFEETLSRSGATNGWAPPMDLFEEPDRYVVRADLPGVGSSDIELEVHERTLTLRGERKMDPRVPKDAYLRIERPYGRFSFQLSLPSSVERKGIQAVHRGGVIEINLPKRKKEDRPSRLRVDVK